MSYALIKALHHQVALCLGIVRQVLLLELVRLIVHFDIFLVVLSLGQTVIHTQGLTVMSLQEVLHLVHPEVVCAVHLRIVHILRRP